jgi:propionate CoA-transferase
LHEGKINKFVKDVEHITFSGEYARKLSKEVLYITERAVFRLGKNGLVLEEIAPGVDLEKDVLKKMDFSPTVSTKLKLMDEKIFKKSKMKIQPK